MSWNDIRGWGAFSWVYDEMASTARDGDLFVEIGVFCGRSLAYLARRLLDRGLRCRVLGVDPWIDDAGRNDYDAEEGPYSTWGAEHAVWCRSVGGPVNAVFSSMHWHAMEELEYVSLWRATSEEAYPSIRAMVARGAVLRGVLIDGDHTYEAVSADIAMYRALVSRTGILAGDDYAHNFRGVRQAVHEAFRLSHVSVDPGQLNDGVYSTDMRGQTLEIRGTTWAVR